MGIGKRIGINQREIGACHPVIMFQAIVKLTTVIVISGGLSGIWMNLNKATDVATTDDYIVHSDQWPTEVD